MSVTKFKDSYTIRAHVWELSLSLYRLYSLSKMSLIFTQLSFPLLIVPLIRWNRRTLVSDSQFNSLLTCVCVISVMNQKMNPHPPRRRDTSEEYDWSSRSVGRCTARSMTQQAQRKNTNTRRKKRRRRQRKKNASMLRLQFRWCLLICYTCVTVYWVIFATWFFTILPRLAFDQTCLYLFMNSKKKTLPSLKSGH